MTSTWLSPGTQPLGCAEVMLGGEPAGASALYLSLLSVGGPDEPEADVLHHVQQLWAAHASGFGVVLLGDHDPHVAPGLHVGRGSEPTTPSRVDQLLRSWEAFDRAFDACPMELEQALFDTHVAPCFETLGLTLAALDLARDHLFLIDARYVGSFPEERWNAHVARRGARRNNAAQQERLLRGLRRVCVGAYPAV